jgi:hypothetical protein
LICPGWDIAICEDGPRILEINAFGDIDLFQHAYRSGFIDDLFLNKMRDRGIEGLIYCRPSAENQSPRNNRFGIRKHHWLW